MPKTDRKAARKERLAAALRANLHRRKAQAKAQAGARQPDDKAVKTESDKETPPDRF